MKVKSLSKTSHQNVLIAMREFSNGKRPNNYRDPDWWYVSSDDGILYPAKAIWSLASGVELKNFITTTARTKLSQIGFELVDIRNKQKDPFIEEVSNALEDTSTQRQERLKTAIRKPARQLKIISDFRRNPDVVAEVLKRANGKCENCKNNAPFIRKSNKTPYLEVHHIVTLAEGGDDTVENAEALCPNCHRFKHFG